MGPSAFGPGPGLIRRSDGAGGVIAVGASVTGLAPGARVVIPFRPGGIDGPFDPAAIATDLGGAVDGVLAEQVAVPARAAVPLPDGMSFEQAATLPCACVPAWAALDRGAALGAESSAERRVGNEWASPRSVLWSPYH